MTKQIIALLILIVAFWGKSNAQDKSPDIKIYKTKFVLDGKDSTAKLSLPLCIIITNDSIIVSMDEKGKARFMDFRIMNKECKWNEDFSVGKSVYKLLMGGVIERKFPTLTVISDKPQGLDYTIELLYEDGGKRIFVK